MLMSMICKNEAMPRVDGSEYSETISARMLSLGLTGDEWSVIRRRVD